jgi:hypothetical protein
MIAEHFNWWLLTMACVAWYSTMTVYVAIRGGADIKRMLARLSDVAGDVPESAGADRSQQQQQ